MRRLFGMWILYYLRFFARLQLRKYSPDIVGVTGSAGKSITKNAIAAVLKDKYRLKVTERGNSESGIPLDILGITPGDSSLIDWLRIILLTPVSLLVNWHVYEKYVVEMGIDNPRPPKNMDYLLTIIRPRTGIFLNVLPVHTEFFDSIQSIGVEKGKLIQSLPIEGLAIVNMDDPVVMAQTKKCQAKIMTFGADGKAVVIIKGVHHTSSGTTISFSHSGTVAELTLPYLLPDHFAYSFAAALCIHIDEGELLESGCRLLEKHFSLPPSRMSLLRGIHESVIIDSSYNSSPGPLTDSLRMLKAIKAKRKIALLGDMRELGLSTEKEHGKAIDAACRVCDELVLVGPLMREFGLPVASKLAFQPIAWFETAEKAGRYLKGVLQKGDVLLVKGSQNTIYLETAVELLLANPADRRLLCRQEDDWKKRKSSLTN